MELKSWNDRTAEIRQLQRELRVCDIESGRKWVNSIDNAARRGNGTVEFYYKNDVWKTRKMFVEHSRFFNGEWEEHFAEAKSAIQLAARLYSKDDPSDIELEKIVRNASEAQRRLKVVANAIDEFDQFCRSSTNKRLFRELYPSVNMPASIGPISRSVITLLGVV